MYRQGLGDCFLLSFHSGGDEKHVLIDCGTLGFKDKGISLDAVVTDIVNTTGGHLHLVIATHQHQDHLSGFSRLSRQFDPADGKRIDNVWMAWTEDSTNPEAYKLSVARDSMALAVKAASVALLARNQNNETGSAMESLLGFLGENSVTQAAGKHSGSDLRRGGPQFYGYCAESGENRISLARVTRY